MKPTHHSTEDHTSAGRRLLGRAPRTRSVVAATSLLVLCVAPFAAAGTGDPVREGVRNGTTTKETEIISNINSTTATKGGYSTRQSNLSASGGGAIYGCRSKAGGSAAKPLPQNPCVRANNLSTGYAFEFNASNGPVVGLISAGTGGDSKKPFVTNATGVATGLNADRLDNLDAAQIVAAARTKAGLDADTVDGKDSTDLQARYAQVAADGTAGTTRGVNTDGVTNPAGDGTYAVAFAGDVRTCALSTAIIGGAGGEISATPAFAEGSTVVTVTTFDSAGAAADRAFHLAAHC
ncbi:MAG: hypothetical protein ACLGI5_17220 [Thermoleophilia bacterium]